MSSSYGLAAALDPDLASPKTSGSGIQLRISVFVPGHDIPLHDDVRVLMETDPLGLEGGKERSLKDVKPPPGATVWGWEQGRAQVKIKRGHSSPAPQTSNPRAKAVVEAQAVAMRALTLWATSLPAIRVSDWACTAVRALRQVTGGERDAPDRKKKPAGGTRPADPSHERGA